MNEQTNIKLSEIFPNLQGRDMHVDEMDLSVRSYNTLKHAGVNNLQELLSVSEYDLIYSGNIPRAASEIIAKLRELSKSGGFGDEEM